MGQPDCCYAEGQPEETEEKLPAKSDRQRVVRQDILDNYDYMNEGLMWLLQCLMAKYPARV